MRLRVLLGRTFLMALLIDNPTCREVGKCILLADRLYRTFNRIRGFRRVGALTATTNVKVLTGYLYGVVADTAADMGETSPSASTSSTA